jgi:hypothetical protein
MLTAPRYHPHPVTKCRQLRFSFKLAVHINLQRIHVTTKIAASNSAWMSQDHVSYAMYNVHIGPTRWPWHGTYSLSQDHVSYAIYNVHIGPTRWPWHGSGSLSQDHVSYAMYNVHFGPSRWSWHETDSLSQDHVSYVMYNVYIGPGGLGMGQIARHFVTESLGQRPWSHITMLTCKGWAPLRSISM